MKHLNISLFAPLLLAALAACSSGPSTGGQNPGTDPPSTLFTETNAWTGELPADAEQITSADFQAQVASGELTLVSATSLAAQKAARQQQYLQDKATLTAVADKSEYLTALLAEANSVPDAPADQQASLPGGQTVVLDGLATRLRVAAEAERQGSSLGNGTDDYARTYELLPPEVQARSPSPDSLKGQSAAQVRSALNALDAQLNAAADLDRLRAEPAGSVLRAQAAIDPGNGSDNNAPCAAPKGLQAAFWFPLKTFLSPIKDQGRRGTCWAFAATAALDSREAVQNGAASNLSEQFLVNKVKEDWDSDDYVDGYTSEKALNSAADRGQAMPPEGSWTYNRSLNRPTDQSGSGAYANSCTDYSGTCSDTSHQSRRVCTTVVFKFCGYKSVSFTGPGVAAGHTIQAWKSGETFNLNRYRTLMAGGHALLASFTVYRGFMDDAAGNGGYVTNFSQTKFTKNADGTTSEVKDNYGGHAVLIVGYIDNVSIGANPLLASIPQAPGGDGYFIVKNSWGCAAADAGYWYVPVAYVKQNFNRLSYLDFDARRSDAWKNAQATPGGAAGVSVLTNPARADLRVQTDVAQWFKVSQSVGAATTLTVTSDQGETLYSGPWTVASGTFGQSLNYTFATAGARTLTLVARTGATETRASLVVNVVNTAPALSLSGSGVAYQGVAYPVTAVVSDLNESGAAKLCASTTWAADAPDTLASGTGCLQTVTFGATGPRQVRVVTHDSDGASTARTLSVTVQPPPVNPYPKISAAGVYARDFHNASGVLRGCYDTAVGVGASINLSDKGCTQLVVGTPPPAPQRYSGGVTVDNPSGEALTYDWTLYVTNPQTGAERVLESAIAQATPGFQLYSPYNAGTTTTPCRLSVRVNAPEASRSKSQTVWSGSCTYETFRLN